MQFLKYFFPFFLLFLFSCSSSSIEQRYKTDTSNEEKPNCSTRFTSGNDEQLFKNEFDEDPVEDHPINVEEFIDENKPHTPMPQKLTDREKVMLEIVKYLNTPYKYGGNTNKGIDCSAFTQNVFSKSLNYKLPRTASQQYNHSKNFNNRTLQFGDLVFFNTTKNSYPGHVGIFIGENLFAHASFSKGVTISSLKSSYFKTRFVGAIRPLEIK